jgi:hypothetical protein
MTSVLRQYVGPIFQGKKFFFDFLILEAKTTVLPQNVEHKVASDVTGFNIFCKWLLQ